MNPVVRRTNRLIQDGRPRPPASALLTAVLVFCALAAQAQTMRGAVERDLPFSLPTVKAALDNIGAYSGNRLPSLEGFADVARLNLKDYQRPYYEYKIELEPKGEKHAVIRVRANVSAWYTGPDAPEPGYRALESNGHLENDLLDRLSDYLRDKSADAATLTQWIATAKQQKEDADRRIAELQDQMKLLENPQAPETTYVAVTRPRVTILAAPEEAAAVMVHAQLDDEFQMLERRGAWIKVELDKGESGWVRASQVQFTAAASENALDSKSKAAPLPGFEVIRENTDEFAGDWARLKGKKALYIWARPDGSAMNRPMGNRLQFVQNVFTERYREMSHSSQDPAEGIVVIFVDDRGGVAAASMEDIRSWVEGTLSEAAFLKKCSLDPPGAFGEPTPGTPAKSHAQHSSTRSRPVVTPGS
jgi:hypothetical protein